MIYTELTNKALCIAYNAHHGQMDEEIACCCAILHDVVEDTQVTMEELAKIFPQEVIDVLKLLTHGEDVPYEQYVRAIKTNPIAVKVKLADIAHNSDRTRCIGSDIPQSKLDAWDAKYAKAKSILLEE